LNAAVLAQLGRIFGPKAADPIALHIKDWAFDPHTATIADQQPPMSHPHYGLPPAMKGLWNDRLMLSGTETGHRFGGYLEGALEAAEISLARVKRG
jgi:monoamine oxidase